MISKRNYEMLAEAIESGLNMTNNMTAKLVIAATARNIAVGLKADNSRFDYARFYEACGLNAFGEVA